MTFRVGIAQISPKLGDLHSNLALYEEKVRQGIREGDVASHLSFCTTSPRPLWPVGPQPRAIMRGRHGLLRPSACRENPS